VDTWLQDLADRAISYAEKSGVEYCDVRAEQQERKSALLENNEIEYVRTNDDRGISGHSQGGLFAAYCLINSDGYFTRFGINSPAFYWDNEKVLNQAVSQFTLNESFDMPATKVFISVGGNDKSDGKNYVSQMKKFQTSLKNADYENVVLNWQIFEGESHVSVYPAMISRTIMSLYGNK
jgi:hypothetical protein